MPIELPFAILKLALELCEGPFGCRLGVGWGDVSAL
jgi:hypothetical protein